MSNVFLTHPLSIFFICLSVVYFGDNSPTLTPHPTLEFQRHKAVLGFLRGCWGSELLLALYQLIHLPSGLS